MEFNTDVRRFSLVTVFVSAQEVRRALGCSRSLAYEHLRRAAGREPGVRGLLRVPLDVWERYAKEILACSGSSGVDASGTAGSTRTAVGSPGARSAAIARPPSVSSASGSVMPRIPITQPRGPRR
jgi:hypothetical protein